MPPDTTKESDDVSYEPRSVKSVFAEMKDTAELLIDLSYSAVLYESEDIANEVLALEALMDRLQFQARMSLMLAARSPEDAEALAPVLGIVAAAEKISNAAGDIAKIGFEEADFPPGMRSALASTTETVVQATVSSDSTYSTLTLGESNLETKTGVRVIALRRDGRWIANPSRETALQVGDVAILRGPDDGVGDVFESMTGTAYRRPADDVPAIPDLDRAIETVVLMKNTSELAVDLAYGAILYESWELAEEVAHLEVELDGLKERLEAWVLKAAGEVETPVSLRGLLHLANATEVISDAALEISESVLLGIHAHPVVSAAIRESDEIVVRLQIHEDSVLAGATIGERRIRTETGMHVVAVRRPGGREDVGGWILSPGPETELHAGDVVLAKGTRAGATRLSHLVGEPHDFDV